VFSNSWNHIEGWIDSATGNYAFYKEGIAIAALTGVDGAPLAGSHYFIGLANAAPGSRHRR
jgi:hypothetical protein